MNEPIKLKIQELFGEKLSNMYKDTSQKLGRREFAPVINDIKKIQKFL